ncbi:MAG: hypothetical protein JXR51_08150 [Bacteroidales bacterium]|nr:hypothetical protein [Bacteroidales bacterium]MBN2757132.1 hypothetical protein [Bacteroidales bacterium]
MKKTFIFISLLLLVNSAYSQVGGLSASKLGTICTETVPKNTIEFEPFFSYASSTHFFDNEGNMEDLFSTDDSTQFFSASGLRFSYGLFENFELGVSLPVDMSTISFGAKYKLPFGEKITSGVFLGYNTIIGNAVYVRRNSAQESTAAMVGGLILTFNFSEKLSCDFNAQYQRHINTTVAGHKQGMFLSTDFGYYLIDNVNFILGMNYFFKEYDTFENNSHLFTLNPGIAIEKAENFILVLNAPIDLFGKNEYQVFGFGLALTIMIN